ncbi:MAG: DUF58 domain-containing protein [Frankiaceae bacterium]|nr:DUF58 domain-containing protein [Frankiaceae bacterium]MBV9871044.1 DUF58 domain-containing protein [Frankiaceae bacterium]
MSTARRGRGSNVRIPHPTRAAALLLVIATILELLGRLIHSTGVTVAAAAALGAVIGDAALSPRVAGIGVYRVAPDRMALGVPATVQLHVTAPGGRFAGRRSVVLIDRHPALSAAQVLTPAMRSGGRASATYRTVAQRRGCWQDAGDITIEAFSPLGGFVRRRRVAVSGELLVHPAPAVPYRLPEIAAGAPSGSSPSPRSGGGVDFYGIREWREGDATTAVHWRASARRNHLVVMERERPAHSALVVVCRRPAAADVWEPALGRAAATAIAALRAGRSVVLVGRHQTALPGNARDVLDWFAGVDAEPFDDPAQLHDALRRNGGAATMLWLSESDTAQLSAEARLARPIAVVTPLLDAGVGR